MDSAPRQIASGLVLGGGVVEWTATILGITVYHDTTQGIGWARNGNIVMGAMFNNYNGASIHMHIAKLHGESFSPTFIAAIMDYPFRQLGVKRVTGLVAENNHVSRRFAQHLGARMEGVLQDALPDGNLLVYGLLRKDANRWLTALYSQRLGAGGINGQRNIQPIRQG